jgi:signal transduction histidine kinase
VFRTTHIRTKLAVALAVPLAALVAVAGFEVVSAVGDVDATRSQTELATSSIGPGSLVTRLQDERNRAAIDLIGLGDAAGLPVADNAEARGLVDEAIPQLRAELDGRGAEVTSAFAPAWEALKGLDALRDDVDAYVGPTDLTNDEFADEVFTRYTDIVEAFFDATATVARGVDDADLRNGVEIVDAAARQSEMRARIVRRVVLAVVTGGDPVVALHDVAALNDRSQGFDDDIRANATGPYAGIADGTFAEPGVQSFNQQVATFLAGGQVNITDMLGAVKSEPDIGYLGLRSRGAATLSAQAADIEADAVARQQLFAGIAVAALLLALVVTWLASRSITRPLASLRRQAEEMAGTRLPAAVRQILETAPGEDVVIPEVEPIKVKSRDEVAEVASALSAVQASAVNLAVEQAVLRRNISDSYINLGRRNQNLLSRQLDFITDLERNEADPDTLEGLFRLDHLATRMRRNAESLLVLAGVEAPRQWSAPVKVSDVVRAALGEVEDYQRVVVRHLEPASVTGAVASDVAHVLAELLENALSFSPPEQSVEVKGRLTTGGYTLAVTDNGLGMTDDDLVRANRRLAGRESFTVAPSRYLGHYVAGHLASRLGVDVQLHDSPAGGITARIDVPMALLADEETDPRLAKLLAPPASSSPAASHDAAATAASATEPASAVALDDSPRGPSTTTSSGPAHLAGGTTASGLTRRGGRHGAGRPTAPATSPTDVDANAGVGAASTAAADRSGDVVFTGAEPAATVSTSGADRYSEPAAAPESAVPPVAPTAAPSVPAVGFGGLAVARPMGVSMYSVAAKNARQGAAGEPSDGDGGMTTSTGLARRVPGAQRPDASFGSIRAEGAGDGESSSTPVGEPARSSPDDVYSFLSSFQSGVARGRADAHTDDDPREDGR